VCIDHTTYVSELVDLERVEGREPYPGWDEGKREQELELGGGRRWRGGGDKRRHIFWGRSKVRRVRPKCVFFRVEQKIGRPNIFIFWEKIDPKIRCSTDPPDRPIFCLTDHPIKSETCLVEFGQVGQVGRVDRVDRFGRLARSTDFYWFGSIDQKFKTFLSGRVDRTSDRSANRPT
jgi:hypothetical protein